MQCNVTAIPASICLPAGVAVCGVRVYYYWFVSAVACWSIDLGYSISNTWNKCLSILLSLSAEVKEESDQSNQYY